MTNFTRQVRSLVSINDLSKKEILDLLKLTASLKKTRKSSALKGKILACCFFEPSTRTRLSFESAMLRLGGDVIGFSDSASTSLNKGESLKDSIRVIGGYADAIVIRHPLEGSAKAASLSTDVPVINAGDGANEHPTQTLLDLFTMQECQKKLEGLKVAMVGDLKYARTIHSLALASALFNHQLYFISPESLNLPETTSFELKKRGVKFSLHRSIEEILDKVDILYMTRLQKERYESGGLSISIEGCQLRAAMLKKAKKNLKILAPLPRLSELNCDVDASEHAYYFEQAKNGLYVRQAILLFLLKHSSKKGL